MVSKLKSITPIGAFLSIILLVSVISRDRFADPVGDHNLPSSGGAFLSVATEHDQEVALRAEQTRNRLQAFGKNRGYNTPSREQFGRYDPQLHPKTAVLNQVWCEQNGPDNVVKLAQMRLSANSQDLVALLMLCDYAAARADILQLTENVDRILDVLEEDAGKKRESLERQIYVTFHIVFSVITACDHPPEHILSDSELRARKRVMLSTSELIAACEDIGLF